MQRDAGVSSCEDLSDTNQMLACLKDGHDATQITQRCRIVYLRNLADAIFHYRLGFTSIRVHLSLKFGSVSISGAWTMRRHTLNCVTVPAFSSFFELHAPNDPSCVVNKNPWQITYMDIVRLCNISGNRHTWW